jgi:hypothetical protein
MCAEGGVHGQDMERPLYMQPRDALAYGVIDGIVRPQTDIIDSVKNPEAWCGAADLKVSVTNECELTVLGAHVTA